jgi:hypothetical protein
MTVNQQRRFYFPLWRDVCKANDWIMVKGRLLGSRTSSFAHGEAQKLYDAVWDIAEILAQNAASAVTADDLRHACHIVALVGPVPARQGPPRGPSGNVGCNDSLPPSAQDARAASAIPKLISSHTLTTTQLNRVARLFEILKEPDDIDAMIAWTDPSVDDRKSKVRWIKSMAPEAYICEVARMFPAFSYPFWEDLPIDNLRSLARLLKKRTEENPAINQNRGSRGDEALTDVPPVQKPVDLSKAYEPF